MHYIEVRVRFGLPSVSQAFLNKALNVRIDPAHALTVGLSFIHNLINTFKFPGLIFCLLHAKLFNMNFFANYFDN